MFSPDPTPPTPEASIPQILVVEDNPSLAEVTQRILSRSGHVRVCETLQQALQTLRDLPADVVILDLGLPDSQGLNGLSTIQEHFPATAIVITTGASDEELALRALRTGAQDYLIKGKLDASALTRSVRYALERKQAENKLLRSERLFTTITRNMVELLSILDTQGRRLYTSPSYNRLLGYQPEELDPMRFQDLVHPEDLPRVREALQTLFTVGEYHGLEYRIRHKSGEYLILESNATRIPETHPGPAQAVLVARDITRRKQAEAERERMEIQLRHAQKLESIGQLAAGIAHEINTPTQYIGDNAVFMMESFKTLGSLARTLSQLVDGQAKGTLGEDQWAEARQTLETSDLDYLLEEVPKAIAQTLEGVKRVTHIVGAMKEFSHPGSDAKTRVDLNRAIESTVTVCRNEWKYLAVMDLDLAPDLPLVPCHPGEFNQAMLNLIINAVHAIEAIGSSTKGTIQIQTRQEGDQAVISVKDTGCGIPPQIMPRIFDPFFTTKPVGKGTGQGLAIVHAILVEKHKGILAVESQPGEGTTFIIRLPLKEG